MSLRLKIPPPIIALAAGVIMWLIARFARDFAIAIPASRAIAASLAVLGVVSAISGVRAFTKARTTLNPMNPAAASTLVDSGIYRFTRNPMYLGLLLLLTGWTVWLSNPLALLGPIAFIFYITRFQIAPEEEALTSLFGEKYVEYKSRVRRWI